MEQGFSIQDFQGIDLRQGKWSLKELPLDKVVPNPNQPRKDMGDIEELAKSIKQNGVIQPIQVYPGEGGKYILIYGERRWRAAKKAGVDTIPCIIVPPEEGTNVRTFVENLYRKDLTPIEQAEAYDLWLKVENKKDQDLADELGLTRAAVNATLQIVKLPQEVRDELRGTNVSARVLRALLKEPPDIQIPLAKAIYKALRSDMEVTEASLPLLKEKLGEKLEVPPGEVRPIKEKTVIRLVKTAIFSLLRKDEEAFLSMVGKHVAMNALKQYWQDKQKPHDKELLQELETWFKEKKK